MDGVRSPQRGADGSGHGGACRFNVWFLILVLPAQRHREPMAVGTETDGRTDGSGTADSEEPLHEETPPPPADTQKPLPPKTVERIKEQLRRYVEQEEHFLDSHLTLGDVLASGCTYNRSYVSRVLNEEMGMSFAAYVNRLRLRRADEYRRSHPTATAADVIAHASFDSPSNYYKAKRKYGEESKDSGHAH